MLLHVRYMARQKANVVVPSAAFDRKRSVPTSVSMGGLKLCQCVAIDAIFAGQETHMQQHPSRVGRRLEISTDTRREKHVHGRRKHDCDHRAWLKDGIGSGHTPCMSELGHCRVSELPSLPLVLGVPISATLRFVVPSAWAHHEHTVRTLVM